MKTKTPAVKLRGFGYLVSEEKGPTHCFARALRWLADWIGGL